jgi:hypothetical protein
MRVKQSYHMKNVRRGHYAEAGALVCTRLNTESHKVTTNLLTGEIDEYIGQLSRYDSDIYEVWLIGSRANGTASDSSDWDLLVFGGVDSLDRLRRHGNTLARENIDVLVVFGDDLFEKPWGDKKKSGSLLTWNWQRVSDNKAIYTQAKRMPQTEDDSDYADTLGMIEKSTVKAIRLWRADTRR